MIFAITNFIILTAISGIHFYWTFGGKWGFDAALPTNSDGKKMLNPRVFETLIVAFGLLIFALLHLEKVQIFNLYFPTWFDQFSFKIIAAIFLIRAVGDFKYVGFFKKIRETNFGKLDTKFYSPLSLFLAINAFLIS